MSRINEQKNARHAVMGRANKDREAFMATLRDAVYGAAVGDALGVPYEFMERGSFHATGMAGYGTHGQPAGTWSDDTSMILATCDSIRELGRIDPTDMRKRFEAWIRRGEYAIDGNVFDFGNTVNRALSRGEGCSEAMDNGNGSLMRIVPLAFADAADDQVREVSAITHAHAVSMDACVQYVGIARSLIKGEDPDILLPGEVRSGGYVLDTLGAALWCLERTGGYDECVLAAVNLGSDTDTTACVAGALAGIKYGYDSIPREWIDQLRGKDIIESCLF